MISKRVEIDEPFGSSLHGVAFYGHLDLVKLLCLKQINSGVTH
jgi:hypothetical protein